MTPERWRQLEAVFHEAVELQEEERAAFLAKVCAGDRQLREEAEQLIAAHERQSSFIDPPELAETVELRDDHHESLRGRRLGHYEIISQLGRGGMGEVFLAHDSRLGRKVALKMLPAAFTQDADRVSRFEREAKAASALNHPNILTIYEIGRLDGVHFIATEFVDGMTLRQRMNGPKMTVAETQDVALQVGTALAAAHEAGIVHRDIKPENVMVRQDGLVKVLDFGLAKLVGSLIPASRLVSASQIHVASGLHTEFGIIMGTVRYMSPEQAAGKPVDMRSDIFSFGVVLYELLTGRLPFTGASDLEILQEIIHGVPDPVGKEVPLELRTTVEKTLEKDPAKRPQSMRDLIVNLRRAQQLTTASKSKKRRRILALVSVILILITSVLSWRLWEADYFWRNPLAGARTERLTDFQGDELDAAVSPDGRLMAFLSNRDGQFDAWLSQIGSGEFVNLTKGRFTLVAQVIRGATPRKVGFSGDGSRAWILEGQGAGPYATWQASITGGVPYPFLAGAMELAWSPDGNQIVYHTVEPGDPLFIADRSGRNPRQILVPERPDTHHHHLTWSLDRRFIYFVKGTPTTEEMDIWRIPASASTQPSKPERITRHNARVAYPAWLDTRTLIYSATAEDGSGQWLYALDTERRIPHRVSSGITEQYLSIAASATQPRRLLATVATPSASLWTVPISDQVQKEDAVAPFPTPNTRALGPRFASDYILFLSSMGGSNGLWKMEGGAVRELWKGSEGGLVAPPAISPDGTQICFSARKQGQGALYLMNADGTNVRTLTDALDVRGSASWSPDGKWLAVAGNQGEGFRVFTIPVGGGPPIRLLDSSSHNPLWSSDGKFIAYSEPLLGGTLVVKAITPDSTPVRMPDIQVNYTTANPYRFVPNRKALIFLKREGSAPQNFYRVDLESGQQRQLTELKTDLEIQSFDVSPDGKQIVFDRVQNNSDIVLMDLPR
jgi:serine/threonine protein kinase